MTQSVYKPTLTQTEIADLVSGEINANKFHDHDQNDVRLIEARPEANRSFGPNQTGYLVITLPVTFNNTMFDFELNIFEIGGGYNEQWAMKLMLGGQLFNASSTWFHVVANKISSGNGDRKMRVRVGYIVATNKCCIVIDKDGQINWNYLSTSIHNLNLYRPGRLDPAWNDDFDVTIVPDLSTISLQSNQPKKISKNIP